MYVRCGYFIGQPVAGKKAELDAQLHGIVELYRRFPRIRWANMSVADEVDEGAPAIYATIQFCFDSKQDLEAALATPVRQELRTHYANAVLPLFEGTIKHANQTVTHMAMPD